MRMLGRSPNWDLLPKNVLSYVSDKNLAESLRVLGNSQDYSDAEKEFVADNKHWYAFSLPMKAVSGETVGELFIMRDMSTSQALFLRFMIVSSGIYAMVVGVMLALIYLLLRRTDMYIHLQQQNIRDNELRFMQLADQSRTMVWEIDAEGMYTYVSDVAALILGYQPDEMIGRLHFYDLHPEEGREAFKIAALEVFARKEPFVDFENQVMTRDGQMIWVATNGIPIENSDGTLAGYRGSDVEITERKKNDEKIRLLAFYDSLSALPNKTLLIERMKLAMSESVRSGEYGALILIDLDNFKIINDTLGYKTGDMMLKQAAQRITSCVRESDTVARLGGDEFVVVLVGLSQNQLDAATASETIAEKILSRLNQKYMLNDVAYSSTASMGMTLFHGHENTLEDLIKQSDLALYRSKAQGKNTLSFFDPEMESALKQRLDLEDALSKGIEEGEFVLYYQPQVYQNGEVVGAEALIRWVHPEKGMISPADFIPIAEDTGLILPLGRWILQAACDQLSQWGRYEKTADITLAVNVSVHQFSQSNFVEEVLAALQHSGADPKKLKLEITESLLISNIEEITEKMNRLKSSGVSFSLDDFGTGYSSLVYLKRLPLDQLKIDQSFVKDLLVNANDAIICKSVIAIAKSMSFSVIAEGVETQQQQDVLAKMGCYDYQGYWFSRPLPLEEFEAFVASSRIDSRL
jgi:diguanylate cyclase (GGDEF)-like protein/PAS domain S-box-containing protein